MVRAALLIASSIFSCASLALAAPTAANEANPDPPPADVIEKLIAELGDEQYAVRRRAEEALMRLGPDAVDALKVAEDNPDLEISERARYIQQRLRVEWLQPDDSAKVRALLTRHGDLSQTEKLQRIEQLAKLEQGEGFGALCRIARLDPSLVTARRAALALVSEPIPEEGAFAEAEGYARELGSSTRAPVEWIRLHLREAKDPRAVAPEWLKAVDAERALLKQKSSETDYSVAIDLVEWRVNRSNELKLLDETTAALLQAVDFYVDGNPKRLVPSLKWALQWMIVNERWDIVSQFRPKYEAEFAKSRTLLYLLAVTEARSNRAGEAKASAERAFEMDDRDENERVRIAYAMAQLGMVDWAEREYRRTVEKHPKPSWRSMKARFELATWLHDRQENEEAARLLAEFCDELDADLPLKQQVVEELHRDLDTADRVDLEEFYADRHYYQAFHQEASKEYDEQRKSLEKALAANPQNPDILIAMYRSPGADEEYRKRTQQRILELSAVQLEQVEEYPHLSFVYNQWAWMIANTEGDYAKALEFSLKSLEIQPDEPGLLDTLGRCYYAVGDFENAVKSQRKAVELAPQFGVMQRQLKLFEESLAAKKAN